MLLKGWRVVTMDSQLALAFFVVVILFCSVLNFVYAATERVIDYEYDGAGNIVRIVTQEQDSPPVIDQLSPSFINVGRIIQVTATGLNLLGAEVSTQVPGLLVRHVQATASQVDFELEATAQVSPGDAQLSFTTGLGQASTTIFVAETPPGLSIEPSPTAILSDNESTVVTLTFSEPRPEQEIYSVSLDDPLIASSNATEFTIGAGQTQATLTLTGIVDGVTTLRINLDAKFYSYSFPIFVGFSYLDLMAMDGLGFDDMKQNNLFASPVGVVYEESTPFPSRSILASPVGVSVNSSSGLQALPVGISVSDTSSLAFAPAVGVRINSVGGVFASPVGVLVQDSSFRSRPVGVSLIDVGNLAFAPPVGTILGPLLDDMLLFAVPVNTDLIIDLTGVNLNETISVSVTPATDTTLNGFTINADGTALSIDLTIGPSATVGIYTVVVEGANGPFNTRSGLPLEFEIQ